MPNMAPQALAAGRPKRASAGKRQAPRDASPPASPAPRARGRQGKRARRGGAGGRSRGAVSAPAPVAPLEVSNAVAAVVECLTKAVEKEAADEAARRAKRARVDAAAEAKEAERAAKKQTKLEEACVRRRRAQMHIIAKLPCELPYSIELPRTTAKLDNACSFCIVRVVGACRAPSTLTCLRHDRVTPIHDSTFCFFGGGYFAPNLWGTHDISARNLPQK